MLNSIQVNTVRTEVTIIYEGVCDARVSGEGGMWLCRRAGSVDPYSHHRSRPLNITRYSNFFESVNFSSAKSDFIIIVITHFLKYLGRSDNIVE